MVVVGLYQYQHQFWLLITSDKGTAAHNMT